MTRGLTLHRAFMIIAGTLLASLVLAPGTANAALVIEKPFAADSGENCPLGYTKGTLSWQPFTPGLYLVVDVKGTLVDRPAKNDPTNCGSDGRYSVATFTAYDNNAVVDSDARQVDNGMLDFGFELIGRPGIDLITVQVCRISLTPGPFDYCGPLQKIPLTP